MAAGDLTMTQFGVFAMDSVSGSALLEAAIDAGSLAATSDHLFVIPLAGGIKVWAFKIEREA